MRRYYTCRKCNAVTTSKGIPMDRCSCGVGLCNWVRGTRVPKKKTIRYEKEYDESTIVHNEIINNGY